MKIVCDDKIPFIKGVFEPFAEVVYLPGKRTAAEDVRDADAIITRTRTACNEALLKGSAVKVIATATIGYDHIDTQWVEKAGIKWASAPGCNSRSVQQYITSVLCVLSLKYGFRFEDMTLGVVGVGNVGSKVAVSGRALGMKVLLCDPPRARREGPEGFVTLDEIVEKCDIVTLHVPLSTTGADATFHLFDEKRLGSMRPSRILINSSRGPVVDNRALKAALKAGALKAAVLDVWEDEPELDSELVGLLDITTPHIAGYSADGKANGTSMSVQTVARTLGIRELEDWTVSRIPAPEQSLEFAVDASGLQTQDVLTEAVLHTYDVRQDSLRLRCDISQFEKLRGDYTIRREPSAFTVKLKGGSPSLRESLRLLDFNIENI